MIRRPPRSTLFPTRRSSDLEDNRGYTKYGKEGLDEVSPGGYIPGSMNNVRIIRYADLKLLAAEALLLSGGSTAEARSEEHTSELQSQSNLVCRLLLEKKKKK